MVKAKALVAAVGVVLTALTAALADDVFSMADVSALLVAIIPAAASVWAVWRVPNAAPPEGGAHT